MTNTKLIYRKEVMENGELVEDFSIENELKKRSLLDKVYSKIDNHIRKFVFKHSFIPETDVVRIGDAVFIDKSTKNKTEYEFSHFEK